MIATSGAASRASAPASSPSRASAQTSKPARSSSAFRSRRMMVSSSATRILIGHPSLPENARPRDGGGAVEGRWRRCGGQMANEPLSPTPLVLRVEISAEQASSLMPLLSAQGAVAPAPAPPQPISDQAIDARVLELRQRESELDQREAEFEADVQFREDRIERWRTELEELEQNLDRRERDLVSYVDQL